MKNKWKWVIAIFFLIFTPIAGVMHQIKGGGPSGSPSTDALCPFGGMETLYSLIANGNYIKKIEPSSLILLGATLLITIVIGRAFCGYICPLGTIQTLLNKLAKKLKIKQVKPHGKVDKVLRYVKYIVLFLILFITYKSGELILRPYDPWAVFMHLGSGTEIFEEFLIGFIILIAILLSSMFIERAWCRYLCPLGATLALLTPLSIFKVRRSDSKCIGCKACTKNCSMGLNVHSQEIASKTECISCGECVSSCPVDNTLEMKKGNTVLSLNKMAAIPLVILVIVVCSNIALGTFKTSSSNVEVLNENGVLNADNIKGYMTIKDVANEFNIDTNIIVEKANLPKDTDINKPLKELKNDLLDKGIEFETEDLKEVVKELIK
ncbi:4Fe-4S binding protein [Clostridium sp. BSD9I1]|uniref:4Fe-4S binding protein n=1 Tax=Clostridium sp. BSD9I1 TaxID=2003589 RepID=UPI001647273E|nr:4Fe-4S binding protein [Clostridium sp. BSD9I1]